MVNPRSVLVVDDLPEITAFFAALTRRMAQHGVSLETETNAQTALDRLKEHPFDLVVSDFRMREADGVEVLRAARESNPNGHRILMTGYNEIPTPVARIQEAHIDAYLQKPLHASDLTLLILDFLNKNESTIETCRRKARELERLGLREEANV